MNGQQPGVEASLSSSAALHTPTISPCALNSPPPERPRTGTPVQKDIVRSVIFVDVGDPQPAGALAPCLRCNRSLRQDPHPWDGLGGPIFVAGTGKAVGISISPRSEVGSAFTRSGGGFHRSAAVEQVHEDAGVVGEFPEDVGAGQNSCHSGPTGNDRPGTQVDPAVRFGHDPDADARLHRIERTVLATRPTACGVLSHGRVAASHDLRLLRRLAPKRQPVEQSSFGFGGNGADFHRPHRRARPAAAAVPLHRVRPEWSCGRPAKK